LTVNAPAVFDEASQTYKAMFDFSRQLNGVHGEYEVSLIAHDAHTSTPLADRKLKLGNLYVFFKEGVLETNNQDLHEMY